MDVDTDSISIALLRPGQELPDQDQIPKHTRGGAQAGRSMARAVADEDGGEEPPCDAEDALSQALPDPAAALQIRYWV